ncbi:uncharacterized protein LOC106152452 [Lingula anatina]|uniref:Uncharacterized protein LOC106152452 n=1 Tax=Lingula anatina TaxID=7574 RepID=A0A1S3H679_LINAN|nr:uncharacterized protein LOC106152452 [Lingula anatina]XP_013381492.1 uncharacterized protein LOC106152452 [Lingula anatina]|eukprot:XP_013381491.1 uncharacterized protein LOC106152452 [Lingula anatina]
MMMSGNHKLSDELSNTNPHWTKRRIRTASVQHKLAANKLVMDTANLERQQKKALREIDVKMAALATRRKELEEKKRQLSKHPCTYPDEESADLQLATEETQSGVFLHKSVTRDKTKSVTRKQEEIADTTNLDVTLARLHFRRSLSAESFGSSAVKASELFRHRKLSDQTDRKDFFQETFRTYLRPYTVETDKSVKSQTISHQKTHSGLSVNFTAQGRLKTNNWTLERIADQFRKKNATKTDAPKSITKPAIKSDYGQENSNIHHETLKNGRKTKIPPSLDRPKANYEITKNVSRPNPSIQCEVAPLPGKTPNKITANKDSPYNRQALPLPPLRASPVNPDSSFQNNGQMNANSDGKEQKKVHFTLPSDGEQTITGVRKSRD